jgi:hypothetical protein
MDFWEETNRAFEARRFDDALLYLTLFITSLPTLLAIAAFEELMADYTAFKVVCDNDGASPDDQIVLLQMEEVIHNQEQTQQKHKDADALKSRILSSQNAAATPPHIPSFAGSASATNTPSLSSHITSSPITLSFITTSLSELRAKMHVLLTDFKQWATKFAENERKTERLHMNGCTIQVADVRGDGKCGPRAVFTWIALDELGILLPAFLKIDLDESPELQKLDTELIGFIDRLKTLMIATVKTIAAHSDFTTIAALIKANARVSHDQYRQAIELQADDEDHSFWDVYITILQEPAYQFTEGEMGLIATLLSRPIEVHMFKREQFINTNVIESILSQGPPQKPVVVMNSNNSHYKAVMPQ